MVLNPDFDRSNDDFSSPPPRAGRNMVYIILDEVSRDTEPDFHAHTGTCVEWISLEMKGKPVVITTINEL